MKTSIKNPRYGIVMNILGIHVIIIYKKFESLFNKFKSSFIANQLSIYSLR